MVHCKTTIILTNVPFNRNIFPFRYYSGFQMSWKSVGVEFKSLFFGLRVVYFGFFSVKIEWIIESPPAFVYLDIKDLATHKNVLGANEVSVQSSPTPQFAFLLLAHV